MKIPGPGIAAMAAITCLLLLSAFAIHVRRGRPRFEVPEGADVAMDGVPLAAARVYPVRPGAHLVRCTVGDQSWEEEVMFARGDVRRPACPGPEVHPEPQVVTIRLSDTSAATLAPAAPAAPPDETPPDPPRPRIAPKPNPKPADLWAFALEDAIETSPPVQAKAPSPAPTRTEVDTPAPSRPVAEPTAASVKGTPEPSALSLSRRRPEPPTPATLPFEEGGSLYVNGTISELDPSQLDPRSCAWYVRNGVLRLVTWTDGAPGLNPVGEKPRRCKPKGNDTYQLAVDGCQPFKLAVQRGLEIVIPTSAVLTSTTKCTNQE